MRRLDMAVVVQIGANRTAVHKIAVSLMLAALKAIVERGIAVSVTVASWRVVRRSAVVRFGGVRAGSPAPSPNVSRYRFAANEPRRGLPCWPRD